MHGDFSNFIFVKSLITALTVLGHFRSTIVSTFVAPMDFVAYDWMFFSLSSTFGLFQ